MRSFVDFRIGTKTDCNAKKESGNSHVSLCFRLKQSMDGARSAWKSKLRLIN
eukprot:jgi/Psemu1/308129/fgenesh1_kg.382_\